MRQDHGSMRLLWKASATALSAGLLAATSWAQAPAPPPAPVAVPGVYCAPGGPGNGAVGGAIRHAGAALQWGVIGYPEYFYEPPAGAYVFTYYKTMSAKANPHRFTLYRTDFLPGTTLFSPTGATRFNLMASRLPRWQGAILVEWSPDEPGLAEARRAAVVALCQRAKLPVTAERVVIAPSPFPGEQGAIAGNNYNTVITRSQQAASSYSLPPSSASGFGGGGGGGGGSQ